MTRVDGERSLTRHTGVLLCCFRPDYRWRIREGRLNRPKLVSCSSVICVYSKTVYWTSRRPRRRNVTQNFHLFWCCRRAHNCIYIRSKSRRREKLQYRHLLSLYYMIIIVQKFLCTLRCSLHS